MIRPGDRLFNIDSDGTLRIGTRTIEGFMSWSQFWKDTDMRSGQERAGWDLFRDFDAFSPLRVDECVLRLGIGLECMGRAQCAVRMVGHHTTTAPMGELDKRIKRFVERMQSGHAPAVPHDSNRKAY
jgi:hypothetical protein